MATVPRKVCDLCRTDQDVDECMIVYQYQKSRPWAVDLCQRCYEQRFGDLLKKAHPVHRSNIKPQYRIEETTFPNEFVDL